MKGHFGAYGGQFVPETLMHPLEELEEAYAEAQRIRRFKLVWSISFTITPAGRRRCTSPSVWLRAWGGGKDLSEARRPESHGRPQDQQCLGQGLLARRMGKKRIIAETGAGQHGVATATVCALLGSMCCLHGRGRYQAAGTECFRMKLLGAQVVPVSSGSKTLKDAINEAMRDWVTNVRTTHYMLGSVLGPHPYPMMVRDFQS